MSVPMSVPLRPRERYRLLGPQDRSDAELIALAIGTGTRGRSALAIARALLDAHAGNLAALAEAPVPALQLVPGLGPARAVQLHAGLQAGIRAVRGELLQPGAVASPEAAVRWLGPPLQGLPHEELHALYLDRALHPLHRRRLSQGGVAGTPAEPAMVFAPALRCGASAVILAHNHPSGDPTPSGEDRRLTRRLHRAGRLLGVPLVDHLVIAGSSWSSLADEAESWRWEEDEPSSAAST